MGLPALANVPTVEEGFRSMIHDVVDEWVDKLLPVFEKDKNPSLMDLSELFSQTRQEFMGACLQKLIDQKYSDFFQES